MILNPQVEVGEIPRIVRVLTKDKSLVQSWKEFSYALDVTSPRIIKCGSEFNQGNSSPYDLFVKILESWRLEKGKAATLSSLCQILEEIKKASAAESLEKEFGLASNASQKRLLWPLFFNVGQVNKHFVGQTKHLTELQETFDNPFDKIVLISGLGGSGKTESTTKFTHDLHKKGNTNCTWFDGETAKSLNQSLISLANKIGISTTSEDGEVRKTPELFANLVEMISNHEESFSWLVVFDNVDDIYPDLQYCLQLMNETERTLTILTSRNRSMVKYDWKLISLEEWETVDAMEFVKRFLSIDTNDEDASVSELCGRLGNHALGLTQPVAYIIQEQRNSEKGPFYSISDYLIEFDAGRKKTRELLNYKLDQTSITTFGTWDTTIAKIKKTQGEIGKLAISILHKIAYFDPTNIPLGFLEIVVGGRSLEVPTVSKEKVVKAVRLLKAYSLIQTENCVIKINRLVQEVIRTKLKLSNKETSLLTTLTEAICADLFFSKAYINQQLSVWKHLSKDDNLIIKFPNMAVQISDKLYDLGLYSEMLNFSKWNCERLSEVLGKTHRQTLLMKHNLALALDEKGHWEKSLKVYEKVWEKMKEILGEEDELTLITANNMAGVLRSLKRFDEATEIYEKVYDSEKKIYGENSVITLQTKHNLAVLFFITKEVELALGMFNEVLKGQLQLQESGKNVDILATKQNIGSCLYKQGKYSEAQRIFENVCELQKAKLGEEHPDTLKTKLWLGTTHFQLGNEEKSLEILQEVLTLREKVLGPTHPYTLGTQKWIIKIKNSKRKN